MSDSIGTKIKEYQKAGWPIRAISSQLHVSSNTVARYVDKIQFSPQVLGYIKSCERKRKEFMNFDPIEVDGITNVEARLYVALLYWCEGSMYPASTSMNFTTSDMQMQKLFLALLRKGFNPIESKFRIWLQVHSDQNKDALITYWSTVLKIPKIQFLNPSVTDKRGGRYRRVYYGTCSLRYSDYSFTLRLMGIYQRFYRRALHALI